VFQAQRIEGRMALLVVGSPHLAYDTESTLNAARWPGELGLRVCRPWSNSSPRGSQREMDPLRALGVNIEAIARELEVEGVKKFAVSYEAALATLQKKRQDPALAR
jgi:hypothetical protein